MKHIVRNFLPQDTRAVEFPSAFALFTLAILLAYDLLTNAMLLNLHPISFWVIATMIIGGLQLFSLIKFPKLDVLRTVCNWVTGTFWIWISFSDNITIGSIAVFFLGFSNLIAFLINTTVLSEAWKR